MDSLVVMPQHELLIAAWSYDGFVSTNAIGFFLHVQRAQRQGGMQDCGLFRVRQEFRMGEKGIPKRFSKLRESLATEKLKMGLLFCSSHLDEACIKCFPNSELDLDAFASSLSSDRHRRTTS